MITDAIGKIVERSDLSQQEMSDSMDQIMSGDATAAQMAGFITALRMKGESVAEVTGAASAMRKHATYIDAGARTVVDTCGTGGDGANSFNISTTAAFVTAGAGLCVAKHGNRAVSSKCGSADVLAALGVNIDVEPFIMEESLQENGIGFLFAPKMHPAMKHVAGPRRELGIRTIFNMIGPLSNPAGATGQILGVFSPELTEMFASVLRELGTRRALVVHGSDGLDEITCCGTTRVSELKDKAVRTYEISAEDLLGTTHDPASLAGGDPEQNAKILRNVLAGREGGPLDVVILNAAAAIVAGELADSLAEGIELARKSVSSGAAMAKLETLIESTQ